MNIVIFSDVFLPKIDGVGISVANFCQLLAERGHNFVICCPQYGENDLKRLGERCRVIRFKNVPLPSYPEIKVVLPSQKKIKKAMIRFKPDIVHIQTPGLMGQYGALAAGEYGVPHIGTYHTLVSEQVTYISLYRLLKVDALLNRFRKKKNIEKRLAKIERPDRGNIRKKLIRRLSNRIYEKGSLIISPSRLIKKDLESQGIKTRIEVVSNGLDLNRFHGSTREGLDSPKAPRLLHAGRISHEKNVEVVLRAFALILEKLPEASLTIVGDGPALPGLKAESERLDIAGRMFFTGFIARENLPDIYRQHDLFLTASAMETQGMVVLEAAGCGLPCVGVDAYALPELIRDGQNGRIVPVSDHAAMARAALDIVENQETYAACSRASLEIAREHDINACADRLEALYEEVIREAGSV